MIDHPSARAIDSTAKEAYLEGRISLISDVGCAVLFDNIGSVETMRYALFLGVLRGGC